MEVRKRIFHSAAGGSGFKYVTNCESIIFKERSFMVRNIFIVIAAAACFTCGLSGCSKKNTTEPESETPTAPAGSTLLFAEGFGGDLSKWDVSYLVQYPNEIYPHLRITTEAAHTGKYSITSDSNRTALLYIDTPRVETGIVGAEFYIMAKAAGQSNFTVEIGQNAGSSGGLAEAFGIGFDPSDSIKCTFYDTYYSMNNGHNDSLLAPIQIDHWYKCAVEVNFTDSTIAYYLDGASVRTLPLPTSVMGIDRLLVFRGNFGMNYAPSAEGPKQYYADDIVLYTK
jgi:hypothetical protein